MAIAAFVVHACWGSCDVIADVVDYGVAVFSDVHLGFIVGD